MARTNAQATAAPRGRATAATSCSSNSSRSATAQKRQQTQPSRQTGAGRAQASASKPKKKATKKKDVVTEEELSGTNGLRSPGPHIGYGFGGLGDDNDDENDEPPYGSDYNQHQDAPAIPTNSLTVSRRDADEPPVDWQLVAEDHQNENNRLKQQKLDIERQLRRAHEDSEAARQAFTELQSEALDLRESIKNLKRKSQEAEDEQDVPRKRRNKKKAAIPPDEFVHADKAGKKFMANYCAFADKPDIFDGFRQAAQEWNSENNHDDEENDSNADSDDNNSKGEERGVAGAVGQKTKTYDLTKTEERERFARDSAIRFFNEVSPKEVEGWEDADYQTRFMDGMSRMRSAFREHEDARLIFGLPINQEDFGRASRKLIPSVAALLKNSTFLGEASTESTSRVDNAYRHKCLLQISRLILFGKTALVDGTKSAMARDVYAYQWRTKTMNINMIAFAAYISFFILSGEANLAHTSKTSHVYWRHLGFLYNQSIKEEPTFIDELLNFYDKVLRLDEDEELEEEDPEQVALLRELEG